ncbi:MalY/PatB family protein [Paenibacillus sediminis]|uniref:cysteine-S-conjugate beta-lyase n=1 Tax=Paenibacillus sediminis TaxID=664909 RepID=A0ABS4H0T6_9BACL|nr:MalY/PatB family protein [Paenibacillus sediminis]MBP1936125.1 cystathionine beta-lyase [Paenibacillus sediminis]
MQYDFNEVIDRSGTSSVKWDPAYLKRHIDFDAEGGLPLWVADMDFRCAAPIINALKERVEHGIYGYSFPNDHYYDALKWWMKKRHGWEIQSEWVTLMPGVVPALNFIIRAFTKEGDKVIIQQPVYHPFTNTVVQNNRIVANNALKNENGIYEMDFEDLEQKAKDPDTKLLILCNPHNPVGKVWSAEELQRLGQICNDNDVIVVSDEIHSDLVLPGNQHTTYALLGESFANHSIICTAPSKTFNLAGLQASNIIIPNPEIKAKLDEELKKSSIHGVNLFGLTATIAAYSPEGEEWLEQLLTYLDANADFINKFVKKHMPKVKYHKPQATYMAWLDFREVEESFDKLERSVKEEAKVLLNGGTMFGRSGEGFMRLNFACPQSILEEALERIANTIYFQK